MLRKKIARRREAVQWFIDSNNDPAKVLFAKPPSLRLCRRMLAEQLLTVETTASYHSRWRPTRLGLALVRPVEAPSC